MTPVTGDGDGTQARNGPRPITTTSQIPVNERVFHGFQLVLPADHLLGDWGGLRPRLEGEGITPTLTFVTDLIGNPVGGRRQGFAEADNLGLNLGFDLEKLWGLRGGSFVASLSQRSGTSLTAKYIGNTFTTQQLYGGSTFKVVDLAYRQLFLDDHVEFRGGRLATGDDFLVSVYDYIFMQNGFDGVPVGIFFNAPGMTAYPNATWGAWLRLLPTKRTYAMGGVYNGDASIRNPDRHGVDMSFRGPAFAIFEAGYHNSGLPGDTAPPGNYKVGVWYDGNSFADLRGRVGSMSSGGSGQAPTRLHGNYGFYALFDQILINFGAPESNRGVGVTACLQGAPDQRVSQIPFFFTAGVVSRGVFPQRPRDVAAFGIVFGRFSADLRAAQRAEQPRNPEAGVQQFESVLEWTYVFRFRNSAFFLQPDLQYIIRPGGTGQLPNALAVGCQIGLNF